MTDEEYEKAFSAYENPHAKGYKMKIEDQLTKQERLRLESFSQAINSSFTIVTLDGARPSLDYVFEQAKRIEEFLKASNPN